MALETKKISTAPESRLQNIETYIDASGNKQFKSLNDSIKHAASQVVAWGVNGQDQQALTNAMTKIKRGLDKGQDAKTILNSISPGSGDNEANRNVLDKVRNGIYAYSKNPQEFLNKEVENIRSQKYEDLSEEEAQGVLDKIDTLSKLSDVSGVGGAVSRTGVGGDTTDYYDWQGSTKANDVYNLSEDVTNLNILLESKKEKAKAEGEVDAYMYSLPEELAKRRTEFMDAETSSGIKQFSEQLAPATIDSLNTRGQFGDVQGGTLPYELAQSAGVVQSSLEQENAEIQASDDAFFQDLAYNNTLRKLIEAGSDVTSEIQYNQAQAEQKQRQVFSSAMSTKKNALSLELAKRSQEIQSAKEKAAQDKIDDQNRSNALTGVLTSAGSALVGAGTSYGLSKLG